MTTMAAGPITARERIEVLDVLRGFALFGILLVNMHFFALPFAAMALEPHGDAALIDRVSEWLVRFFAQGKFYTLFSFLFGLGFSIFILRAEQKGARPGRLFARRLLVLLLIGTLHAFFIWMGDILMTYAFCGFLLLLFRKRQPKTLLIWAVILLLLGPMLMAAFAGFLELGKLDPERRVKIEKARLEQRQMMEGIYQDSLEAYGIGSFERATARRAYDVGMYWTWAPMFMPSVLAMFLVGLWAGRRDLLRNFEANRPLIRKIWLWSLPIGLVGNAGMTYLMEISDPTWPSPLGALAQFFGAAGMPALSMFYASSLVLLWHSGWRQRLRPLTYVGRMALTNYLLQSVVCTLIFYGYGLGMFGRVPPRYWIPMTVVIYAAQFPLSKWWLSRYQFGPAEWLWRSLTYGKAQPMRLGAARAVAS